MNLLLGGSVGLVLFSILLAWLVTFARVFPINGVKGTLINNPEMLLKGHIDYVLMALFFMAFYAVGIEFPMTLQVILFIGAITNPGIFLFFAFLRNFWDYKFVRAYTAISFTLTTYGFGWVGYIYINHFANPNILLVAIGATLAVTALGILAAKRRAERAPAAARVPSNV